MAAFSFLAPFSCKKNVEPELEEYTPLSKIASDLSGSAEWAYEIESGRLDKKIDSFEAISKSVSLSPLALAALEGAFPMASVYPELEGFGSLDTSSLQGELLEMIKAFCLEALDYTKKAEEFERLSAAKKKQGEEAEEEDSSESSGAQESEVKKDSSKIDSFFAKRSLFSLALFLEDGKSAGVLKSFVVGKPFVGEELIEVPVRWTGEKETLYTKLYPVQEGESWKIQQIEIYKWEEKDGSVKTDRD